MSTCCPSWTPSATTADHREGRGGPYPPRPGLEHAMPDIRADQRAMDFADEAPIPAETLGDGATGICRNVCEMFGIATWDEDLKRVHVHDDQPHRDVAAQMLLMHLEDVEENLLDEDAVFYRLAMVGARQLIGKAMTDYLADQ